MLGIFLRASFGIFSTESFSSLIDGIVVVFVGAGGGVGMTPGVRIN